MFSKALICIAITAAVALISVRFSHAAGVAYVSSTGTSVTCTAQQPCGDLLRAVQVLSAVGQVLCLDAPSGPSSISAGGDANFDIDCPHGVTLVPSSPALLFNGIDSTVTMRNMTFRGAGGASAISVGGAGTIIIDNCVFSDFSGPVFDIEPGGLFILVIKNSRITKSGSGILLKPAANGSIRATLDRVTIAGNVGGGIKTDSTNGAVNLDMTDGEISNNGGNGINLVSGAAQNMLNLGRTVIAKNGGAGLQANGGNAAGLVDTTLFDSNANGATIIVNGGHILTYGNNRIVGSPGSGFTSSAALQ
jgi:hypothetical protein